MPTRQPSKQQETRPSAVGAVASELIFNVEPASFGDVGQTVGVRERALVDIASAANQPVSEVHEPVLAHPVGE